MSKTKRWIIIQAKDRENPYEPCMLVDVLEQEPCLVRHSYWTCKEWAEEEKARLEEEDV